MINKQENKNVRRSSNNNNNNNIYNTSATMWRKKEWNKETAHKAGKMNVQNELWLFLMEWLVVSCVIGLLYDGRTVSMSIKSHKLTSDMKTN